MNNIWYIYCLIILLSFSCSNKNNINVNSDNIIENLNQEDIYILNNIQENIDVTKILNSVFWNIDQNKVDELSIKFDENKLTDEDIIDLFDNQKI
jgi:hypothetical protein